MRIYNQGHGTAAVPLISEVGCRGGGPPQRRDHICVPRSDGPRAPSVSHPARRVFFPATQCVARRGQGVPGAPRYLQVSPEGGGGPRYDYEPLSRPTPMLQSRIVVERLPPRAPGSLSICCIPISPVISPGQAGVTGGSPRPRPQTQRRMRVERRAAGALSLPTLSKTFGNSHYLR